MVVIPRPRWAERIKRHLPIPQWLRLRLHPYPEQFSAVLDLAPFGGEPSLYLLATTPRSGSHFVGHALASSGHYGFPLEYLNRGNLDIWRHRFGVNTDEAALTQIMRLRTGPTGLFGLKAHWSQYQAFRSHPMLTGPRGIRRIVWLTRRNVLSQAISFAIANHTGQFISGAARRGTARFDYAEVMRCARSIRNQNLKWQEYLTQTPHLPLYHAEFEKILSDKGRALAAIGHFIDPAGPGQVEPGEKTQQQSDDTAKVWAEKFRQIVRDEDRWVLSPYSPVLPLHAVGDTAS
jgi:LPS sulfotransferase NodH